MKAVVTGAAGFIGSHLCERLLADGHEVVGIDCFTDYYRRARKEQNLEVANSHRNFSFEELDLVDADLTAALEGAGVVYHLAGQRCAPAGYTSSTAMSVRTSSPRSCFSST